MKKIMPLLCAVTIVSSPFSVYVQAAEEATTTEVNPITDETTVEETSGLEQVDKLTLEDVINRGVENNKNLTVLQLNLEVAKNQLLDTEFDKNDVKWDIRDLENKLDDLKDARADLTDMGSKIANGQERLAIKNTLDTLADQIQSLELAITKLETGQIQLQLQEEEAKAGVRLLLTSAYTSLTLMQDQLDFLQQSIKIAHAQVNKANRMYEIGTGSKDAVRQAVVAETNLKKQIEEVEKNYHQALANLSFDIGVAYNPATVIVPIDYTAIKMVQPKEYSALIDNTYKVKTAQKKVESAIFTRDDAYREYKEDDYTGNKVSKYELAQHDYEVKAAEEVLALTKDQIETAIEQLYYQEELAYFAYEEALRKQADIKQDVSLLQVRYKLGVLSKHDYETALIQTKQAELTIAQTTMKAYLTQQSIQALEAGYIQ